MSYLKDFQTKIALHDYPACLQLWEEYCNSDELDSKELCAILTVIKKSDLMQPFGRHVERILPLWLLLEDEESSYQVLKLIVDIASTNTEQLANLILECLNKRFANQQYFADKVKLVGLRTRDKFQGAISSFELLNHMQKGNFVFHTGGWGVGLILDVSFVREQLSVEFENIGGKRDLAFNTAFKVLVGIPKEHFLAVRFVDPDRLEKDFKEEPVKSIKKLLADLGPKTAAEIKDELCEFVIPAAEWSRWWSQARAKLKKDSMLDSPEDSKGPFSLRTDEFSSEKRFKQAIEAVKGGGALTQTIYTFYRDFAEISRSSDLKQYAIQKLSECLATKELTTAEEIELLLLMQEMGKEESSPHLIKLIQDQSKPHEILEQMQILALKKRFLQEIRKIRADFAALFQDLLLKVDYNPLRDYILGEIGSVESKKTLEKLLDHPGKYPDAYLWYFQKIFVPTTPDLPFADKEGRNRLFESLLILLSQVEPMPGEKNIVKKVHSLLSEDRYSIVRSIMQNASAAQVSEFLLLATKCHSLSDHEIKIFHSLAEVAHPSLAKSAKKKESDESDTLWCTQEGYLKLQKRVQHIATVETVENAREIEVARGHGDLRENAEFKAALERRDRLQNELKLLSTQLNSSRVLSKEDVITEEASVGCEVLCKSASGKNVTYVLLGPWDADPEKNILSMQSKLAQTIKGLSIGDTFKFQDEEYTVADIRNHFEK